MRFNIFRKFTTDINISKPKNISEILDITISGVALGGIIYMFLDQI